MAAAISATAGLLLPLFAASYIREVGTISALVPAQQLQSSAWVKESVRRFVRRQHHIHIHNPQASSFDTHTH